MTNHKNVKKNKHLGGSEECKTSLFKPLVATSLALALGVSVASAESACINAQNSTTPIFCTTTNGTLGSPLALSGVNWNGSNGGGNTSFWTLGANSGTTPVNITLQFNKSGNGTGSLSGDTYTISQNGTIGTTPNTPILQLSSTTRGIDMQGKTLIFDFLASNEAKNNDWNGSSNTNKRKMILDLSGTTTEGGEAVSLKGNLTIKAGKPLGTDVKTYQSTNRFEATFGGDVIGDINVLHSNITDPNGIPYFTSELKYNDLESLFIFKNDTQLKGKILSQAGENTFVFENNGGITGGITINIHNEDNFGINPKNRIVFKSGSASIGTSTDKQELIIQVNHDIGGVGQMGSNTLITDTNVSSSNFYFKEMSVHGGYFNEQMTPSPKTFNVISLNNNGSNTLVIDKITQRWGNNLIGQNLATFNSSNNTITYASNIFSTATDFQSATEVKNVSKEEFIKSTYTAKGTLTSGAITSTNNGGNYINIENANVNGDISAGDGGNLIVVGNGTFRGNILALGRGSNTIQITTSANVNGSITARNSGRNDIVIGSGTIISSISASGSGVNNITATSGNFTIAGISTKDWTGNVGGNTLNLGSATLTINARSGDSNADINGSAIYAWNGDNSNTITAETIQVNGDIVIGGGAPSNTLTGKTIGVKGNISGSNNFFTLTADTGTLTLTGLTTGGTTHYINTLKAGNTSGQDNSLILDNSSVTSGAMETTIDTLTNGANLTVTLKGAGAGKEATLIFNRATTIKALTLGNNSTGNTLYIKATTGYIDINTAVNVTSGQELTLKAQSGSGLSFGNGLTTQSGGTSIISAVGGNSNEVSTFLRGEQDISATKLVIDSSNSSSSRVELSKTTPNSGTTMNFSFGEFETNTLVNNIKLNDGVASLTLGTTSNSLSAENPVSFGNISYLGTSNQAISINGGENIINTLTLSTTSSLTNTFSIGGGSTSVGNAITASNIFALNVGSTSGNATLSFADSLNKSGSGATNVTFKATSGNYVSTLSLGGADNYISSITTEANANGVLEATAGDTTVNTITNNSSLTLALSSSTETPSNTKMTLNSAITKGGGSANVTFTGGTDNHLYHSTLVLTQSSNALSSVASSAKNAVLAFKDSAGATIDSITIQSDDLKTPNINEGGSLVFAFNGSGNSQVEASNGISVGNGAVFGISLSGSGTKTINGNITFGENSTLLIDFADNNSAIASINFNDGTSSGTGAITIRENRNSIINFHGTNTGTLNGDKITIDGGNNTINFLGSATMSGLNLKRGVNTINVRDNGTLTGVEAVIADITASNGEGLGGVTNIINLENRATLKLGTNGDQTLTSTDPNKPSTLNFIGDKTTLQGGFGASGNGVAIINVGEASADYVSGRITGAVSNASLNFNAGESTLILAGGDSSGLNTFKSLTSTAENGTLFIDASSKDITAQIDQQLTIGGDSGAGSITFALNSSSTGGNHNAGVTLNNGIVVGNGGTLGISIEGDGSGERKVSLGSGKSIELQRGSTLRVDLVSRAKVSAVLGSEDQIFNIGSGANSQINFYEGTQATLTSGGLNLVGGTNTVNFYGSATLSGINLKSGTNIINVRSDEKGSSVVTGTIKVGDVGSVSNTINLETKTALDLQDGNNGSGSGSLSNASVNVYGAQTEILGNLNNSSITFKSANADLTLSGENTLTSLKGFSGAETYTRNGRVLKTNILNTLILDGSNPSEAKISQNIENSNVTLEFGTGSEEKRFELNGASNEIKSVAFGSGGSTSNTLAFTKGNSTLENASVSSGNGLTIELGNANLALTNGYNGSGTRNLSITGNASVSGRVINANTLTFANNTSLSVSNSGTNTFASVNASNVGTLIANDSALTITSLTGDKLTAGFSGNGTSRIAISGGGASSKTIILADVVLNNNANGTLDLSSLTNTTITNNVSVGANQSLAINLGGTDTTLAFTGGLSGNATINAGATSNIIAGSSIALSNLNLGGTDNTTTLTASNVAINTLNANATGTNTLKLDATSGNVSASINTISKTTRGVGELDIALISTTSNATTLSLNGNSNTINSLDIQGDKNNLVGSAKITSLTSANGGSLNINGGNVEVANAIEPTSSHNMSLALNSGAKLNAVAGLNSGNGSNQINLTLNNSTLSLGADSTITNLAGNGGVIDFVASGKDTSKSLTITGDCNANANVITYVSGNQANIVEASNDTGSGTLTISAVGSADEIFSITYENGGSNNVKVAQIGNSGTDKAVGGTSDIEGEIIQISLSTDGAGGYYIGSAVSKGVDTSVQEVASSALAVNYDLYLANFNSLNKRMGELRNTQESNGVWARVFGGAISNDFGVGSKTDYITTQAGYDYSLSVGENARNFIGVALAYGASSTKSNPSSNPNTGVIDNINSSMVEVGLYNSYVADSGWYNDTIFKFDYIMSDFTLKTGANSQQNSTSNFAMILSDEFGYRYSFGENEKGSWYIDPQLELAFGYFNQSDFNQAINESGTRTIKATQDTILTLRTRVGASLGKKFNTEKGFASLYVGAFYEYDYIEGGKSNYSLISSGQEVSNPLQSLESNGRAILNVGSNIELTKGARLYIDVEKSFGDKQRTFMQFNLGARYSF